MAYNTGGRTISGPEARRGDGARPEDKRVISGMEAKQGIKLGVMRYVLVISSIPGDHRLCFELGGAAPVAVTSTSRRAASGPKPPRDLPRGPVPDELPPETPPEELPPERDPPPGPTPQEFPPSPSPGEMPPGEAPPSEIPVTARATGPTPRSDPDYSPPEYWPV